MWFEYHQGPCAGEFRPLLQPAFADEHKRGWLFLDGVKKQKWLKETRRQQEELIQVAYKRTE